MADPEARTDEGNISTKAGTLDVPITATKAPRMLVPRIAKPRPSGMMEKAGMVMTTKPMHATISIRLRPKRSLARAARGQTAVYTSIVTTLVIIDSVLE